MNSEPNYKVLSTVTINGNKVELREYATYWSAAVTDKHDNTEEYVRSSLSAAKDQFNVLTP